MWVSAIWSFKTFSVNNFGYCESSRVKLAERNISTDQFPTNKLLYFEDLLWIEHLSMQVIFHESKFHLTSLMYLTFLLKWFSNITIEGGQLKVSSIDITNMLFITSLSSNIMCYSFSRGRRLRSQIYRGNFQESCRKFYRRLNRRERSENYEH